jgi:acyl carrier protein
MNKEKFLEILEDVRPDVDFENEDQLVDGNILDSFDIITIVGEIKNAFGINITVTDIVPENFNSVEKMIELIGRYA